MVFQGKKVYFIGIGGSGMSSLAILLQEQGAIVSGSDLRNNSAVQLLRRRGIPVYIGHKKENLANAQIVCYSTAVKKNNEELVEAFRRNLIVIHRAELLAQISQNKPSIIVSGSHGKSTTSTLLAYFFRELGKDPNVFLGAVANNYNLSAWSGKGPFIIEADESDGSFLNYRPWISLITNIDYEHIDYYQTMEELQKAFSNLVEKTSFKVVACQEDNNLIRMLANNKKVVFYGFQETAHIQARNIKQENTYTYFDLTVRGKTYPKVALSLLGLHNVLNFLGAVAVCEQAGISPEKIIPLALEFKGVKRRLQFKGKINNVYFFDDYAHHPTEIKAVLDTLFSYFPNNRIVVLLQPHRYSRVKLLKEKFAFCFPPQIKLIVTDIYSAGETKIVGIDSLELVKEIEKNHSNVIYMPKDTLIKEILNFIKPNDIFIGLGAGDINSILDEIFLAYGKQVKQKEGIVLTN